MSELDRQKGIMYSGFYRGKVVSVDDPDKLGRIKVEVYPMCKRINERHLPWAVPAMGLFAGAGSGTGSFCVPQLHSFVYVFFEEGDIYQPVYFAEAQSGVHGIPSEVQSDNYPNVKAFKSSGGFSIVIDDGSKELKITHPDGAAIKISSEGTLDIEASDPNVRFMTFVGTETPTKANNICSLSNPSQYKLQGAIQVEVNGNLRWIKVFR